MTSRTTRSDIASVKKLIDNERVAIYIKGVAAAFTRSRKEAPAMASTSPPDNRGPSGPFDS